MTRTTRKNKQQEQKQQQPSTSGENTATGRQPPPAKKARANSAPYPTPQVVINPRKDKADNMDLEEDIIQDTYGPKKTSSTSPTSNSQGSSSNSSPHVTPGVTAQNASKDKDM